MHGGHSGDHHGEQLQGVALEVHQLHHAGLGNERLVQVGTHQALDLTQRTQLRTKGRFYLGREGEEGKEIGGIHFTILNTPAC